MANGNFGGGDGSPANPYLVEDADDLNAMRRRLSASYKLVNDVNLGVTSYNLDAGWKPIDGFSGVFDGNFRKIINLYINRPDANNVGFFGQVNDATVRNVAFDNAVVYGNTRVGVVVGQHLARISSAFDVDSKPSATANTRYNLVVASGTVTAKSNAGGLIGDVSYVSAQFGSVPGGVSTIQIATQCISKVFIDCQSIVGGILTSQMGSIVCQHSYLTNWGMTSGDYNLRMFISDCVVLGQFSNTAAYANNVYSSLPPTTGGTNVSVYVDSVMTNRCTLTTGDKFTNLSKLDDPSTTLALPDLDNMFFDKTPDREINFDWNVDRSYFIRLNDGYYVFDHATKAFVKRYTVIDNDNVYEAVRSGNNSLDLLTTGCFELLKAYGSFDVVSVQNTTTAFVGAVKVASFGVDQAHGDGDHVVLSGHVNFDENNGEIGAISVV